MKHGALSDILPLHMENIYTYFAQFLRAAKRAGWSPECINAVLADARSSDYEHALEVLYEAMEEIRTAEEEHTNINF